MKNEIKIILTEEEKKELTSCAGSMIEILANGGSNDSVYQAWVNKVKMLMGIEIEES